MFVNFQELYDWLDWQVTSFTSQAQFLRQGYQTTLELAVLTRLSD